VQYGKRKLAISPLKSQVEANTPLLIALSATRRSEINEGIGPIVDRLFDRFGNRGSMTRPLLQDLPVLEFIARRYPPAWIQIADLHESGGTQEDLAAAKNAVMRCLDSSSFTNDEDVIVIAWNRLTRLCRKTHDFSGEIHALLELSRLPTTKFRAMSEAASRLVYFCQSPDPKLKEDEASYLASQFAAIMEEHSDEADATDFSRLAWLYVLLKDPNKAKVPTDKGLKLDPTNVHCMKLRERLSRKF